MQTSSGDHSGCILPDVSLGTCQKKVHIKWTWQERHQQEQCESNATDVSDMAQKWIPEEMMIVTLRRSCTRTSFILRQLLYGLTMRFCTRDHTKTTETTQDERVVTTTRSEEKDQPTFWYTHKSANQIQRYVFIKYINPSLPTSPSWTHLFGYSP